MEEEAAFVSNLASLLEVSLVEDTNSMVLLTAAKGSAGSSGEPKQNNVSINGIAHSDQESASESKLTDVSCNPVGEQVEAQGTPDQDSESPSKLMLTHVPCLAKNAMETLSGMRCYEPLISEIQSQTDDETEEKQMYYSVFKDLKKVMYLRLHCTVCDCHIGCTPAAVSMMAFHKFLHVLICRDCENFYGNGDFACGEDGSETFCRWCGQGGRLYCCSHCPSVFCKKCIRRNLGKKAVNAIEESNDWRCYRCDVRPLWDHRALCWGLSRFLKEQSNEKNKIPEDVAVKTPGFNALLCCQGEKLPYYRTSQPLRPIVWPAVSNAVRLKNLQSLMAPSSVTSILRNSLTGAKAPEHTVLAPFTNTSPDTAVMPAGSVSRSSKPVGSAASLASSIHERLIPSENASSYNVSDSGTKTSRHKAPDKPDGGKTNSTVLPLQNPPQLTYERAFLNHVAQSAAQSQTQNQNKISLQKFVVPVTAHVRPVNVMAPMQMTYIQRPLGTIILSPRSSSVAGSAVNKVLINPNNLTHMTYPMNVSPMQCVQHIARTPLPVTQYEISGGSNVLPNAAPVSNFSNRPFPNSDHTQFTRLPSSNTIPQKNAENNVQTKDMFANDDDDDIIEVFSTIQNLADEQNTAHEWMMRALMKTDRTSKILAYHVEVLQQRLKRRSKKTEINTKGISRLAGKLYRMLKRASKSLNLQRAFLSKEFTEWLNGERTKHGISTTQEREPNNSSPVEDRTSRAETSQEPELLLDMEISCESDHEDRSSPNSIHKEHIECDQKLSDSDTDSDDPFSDSESSKWENVQASSRPFFLCTVQELLKDQFSSKLLLQVLTEQHSKTADSENKQISSRKENQLVDTPTQTAAPREEELSAGEKEYNDSPLKQHVYRGMLPERISSHSGNLALHSSNIDASAGTENEEHVRMEAADLVSEAIRDSLMESSSSGINDMTGNEGSHAHEIPCNNNKMKSLDLIRESVKDFPKSVSPSREKKTMNEDSYSVKTACSNSWTECVDPVSKSVQNSPVMSSYRSPCDKTENGESRNETQCCDSNTKCGNPLSAAVQHSLVNISTRIDKSSNEGCHRNKNACSNGEMTSVEPICETLQNSSIEMTSGRTDDKTNNEKIHRNKTPCKNNEAGAMDPVSETVENSLTGYFTTRTDNELGETLCKNSSIYSGDSFDAYTESNNIHMNRPLQKRTAPRGRCNDVNRKRRYQHISSNNKADFCGQGRASTVRTDSPVRTDSTVRTEGPLTDYCSPSPVIAPVTKLHNTEVPVNDFATLVNSALQKKLIKPCFVSVVKFSRND